MSIVNELLEELQELKKYKERYKSNEEDKKKLAQYVYNNELKEYYNTPYENRCKKFIEENCSCCRYNDEECKYRKEGLRADILEPIENEGWFPSYQSCGGFEWN